MRVLVSIVVNSYNYAHFLPAALDSALAQTYPHTEVIVVDDGSTDHSCDVIATYSGRVRAVLKANAGQASALNAGFAASHGDVVCFLDSDDVLDPTAAACAAGLAARPDAAMLHWPLRIVDASGQPSGTRIPDGPLAGGDLRRRVVSDGPLYSNTSWSPNSGNAWSRRFLDEVLPMPESDYVVCADEYLLTLAPAYGEVLAVEDVHGGYRAHGSNHGWHRALSDDQVQDYLRRYERNCQVLASALDRQGIAADPRRWQLASWNYGWLQKLLRARHDVLETVPSGETVVLLDEGEWGEGDRLPGRRVLPFPERDGSFAGRPANGENARDELLRLHTLGARWLAVWWTQWWWLDHYAALADTLADCTRVVDNDRIIVFDLDRPIGSGPADG